MSSNNTLKILSEFEEVSPQKQISVQHKEDPLDILKSFEPPQQQEDRYISALKPGTPPYVEGGVPRPKFIGNKADEYIAQFLGSVAKGITFGLAEAPAKQNLSGEWAVRAAGEAIGTVPYIMLTSGLISSAAEGAATKLPEALKGAADKLPKAYETLKEAASKYPKVAKGLEGIADKLPLVHEVLKNVADKLPSAVKSFMTVSRAFFTSASLVGAIKSSAEFYQALVAGDKLAMEDAATDALIEWLFSGLMAKGWIDDAKKLKALHDKMMEERFARAKNVTPEQGRASTTTPKQLPPSTLAEAEAQAKAPETPPSPPPETIQPSSELVTKADSNEQIKEAVRKIRGVKVKKEPVVVTTTPKVSPIITPPPTATTPTTETKQITQKQAKGVNKQKQRLSIEERVRELAAKGKAPDQISFALDIRESEVRRILRAEPEKLEISSEGVKGLAQIVKSETVQPQSQIEQPKVEIPPLTGAQYEEMEKFYGKDLTELTDQEVLDYLSGKAKAPEVKSVEQVELPEPSIEETKAEVEEILKSPEVEKIEDVDIKTSHPEPNELVSNDSSIFRQDSETTIASLEQYRKSQSVARSLEELYVRDPTKPMKDVGPTTWSLITEVNHWLNGGNDVDIASVRNFLSSMAERADDFKWQFEQFGMTSGEVEEAFNDWKELVSDAAVWARRVNLDKEMEIGRKIERVKELLDEVRVTVKEPEDEFGGGEPPIMMSLFKKQALKIIETQFTLDKTNILPALLKDISNQNPAKTMMYELLQNSLDAFEEGTVGRVDIDIPSLSSEIFEFSFKDNGKGMTPEEVQKFFLVGGSVGKSGTTTRGGYGLAKIALLLIPERIKLTTVRNGVKSIVEANREQIYNGTIQIKSTPTNEPNGTTFYAVMPNEVGGRSLNRANLYFEAVDLANHTWANAEIHINRGFLSHSVEPSNLYDLEKVAPTEKYSLNDSTVAIHFIKTEPYGYDFGGMYNISTTVTNKGLAVDVSTTSIGKLLPTKPNFRIVIDFEKTPPVRDERYPFLKNRTEITEEHLNKIKETVNRVIDKISIQIRDSSRTRLRNMVENSPTVEGVKVYIPYEGKTLEKVTEVVTKYKRTFSDFAKILNKFTDILKELFDANVKFEMTVDPKCYGYHMKASTTGTSDIYAINPTALTNKNYVDIGFSSIARSEEDIKRLAADAMAHTLVHEYAHTKEFNHSEGFTIELGRIITSIGHERLTDLVKLLRGFYDKHWKNISNISEDLRYLQESEGGLKEYIEGSAVRHLRLSRKGGVSEDGERSGDVGKERSIAERIIDTLKAKLIKDRVRLINEALGGVKDKKKVSELKKEVEKDEAKLDKLSSGLSEGEETTYDPKTESIIKAAVEAANKFRAAMDRARDFKKLKARKVPTSVKEELVRMLVERSGNASRMLTDPKVNKLYGGIPRKVQRNMYLSKGGVPRAYNMYEQRIEREVYGGLSKEKEQILDDIIMAIRMIDIGKYKKNFKFPEGQDPLSSMLYLATFESKFNLTPEEAYDLYHIDKDGNIGGRAGAYFDAIKEAVRCLRDEAGGIIGQKEYEDLVVHRYRRLGNLERPATLAEILDKKYKDTTGEIKRSVYESGIDVLASGHETDILEPSGKVMAYETFIRIFGRLANNEANRQLLDLARQFPENPFVRVKLRNVVELEKQPKRKSELIKSIEIKRLEQGISDYELRGIVRKVTGKSGNIKKANVESLKIIDNLLGLTSKKYGDEKNKIPKGWIPFNVYEKGHKTTIWLEPEFAKEWTSVSKDISPRAARLLKYATLAPVTRVFATGIEPKFGFTNPFRDAMHVWFAAREWIDGEWRPVYSPVAPIALGQLAEDIKEVAGDALIRGKLWDYYMNHYGGMDFLVLQARPFQKGMHVDSKIDRAFKVAGYLNESGEIIARLAVMWRTLKNIAARTGKTVEEVMADRENGFDAVFAARDYMDFGQGGWAVKLLDQGIPYLNAAIVAGRTFVRSFNLGEGNKQKSRWKLLQFVLAIGGLYVVAKTYASKTLEGLRNDYRSQNNIIIPLGDCFGFEDADGQMRYPFIMIPLDQSVRVLKKFTENLADIVMGDDPDTAGTINAIKNLSPVDTGSWPPLEAAIFEYLRNYDLYRARNIREEGEVFGWPRSKEEVKPTTPQILADLGAITGASPERLKVALSEMFTGNSTYGILGGAVYNELFSKLPEEERHRSLFEALSQYPVSGWFIGITSPYSKFSESIEKAVEDDAFERFKQRNGLDLLVEGYFKKTKHDIKTPYGTFTPTYEGIEKYIATVGSEDRQAEIRLRDRLELAEEIRDLPHRSFWMRFESLNNEAKAKLYVNEIAKDKELSAEFDEVNTRLSRTKRGRMDTEGFRRAVITLEEGMK